MPATRIDDPVLVRFRQEPGEAYGSKLERVVLFGSRARGDAQPDSDYDIAVFIHEPESFGEEAARLATIGTGILYDTDAVINALPCMPAATNSERGSWPRYGATGLTCDAGGCG